MSLVVGVETLALAASTTSSSSSITSVSLAGSTTFTLDAASTVSSTSSSSTNQVSEALGAIGDSTTSTLTSSDTDGVIAGSVLTIAAASSTVPSPTSTSTSQTGGPRALTPVSFVSFDSVVPLTTVFSPLPTCTSGPWVSIDSTQGTITCTQSLDSSLTASCYPASFTAGAAVLYSPGVCPSAYSAAASWTSDGVNITTSICCPRGMSYLQLASSCAATLPNDANDFELTGTPLVIWNSTVQYRSIFTAFAPTLAVAWASSDLAQFTPIWAPLDSTITSSASVGTPASTSSAGGPPASPPASPSDRLNRGTEAGIGVAASVVGVVIGMAVWLFWRRRKARANRNVTLTGGRAELEGEASEKQPPKIGELETKGEIHEFDGKGKPTELGTAIGQRHELDGGFRGHEVEVSFDTATQN
ncbi:hypothetical protein LTR56_016838 [Elasticomyces elasticus]|nr:hypothetical protein LTR56_016838 [Elasticomyces elasticus]KAK3666676.1 hypothetical protein LTR22_002625 [Elasticomyces elasticus]KAK4921631.1 hypothetical protein LTR49_010917 [Elasticomyces elasticus]KAK5758575.1 hypothetical protein LTS12_011274 [Elasticomyces elasticus]